MRARVCSPTMKNISDYELEVPQLGDDVYTAAIVGTLKKDGDKCRVLRVFPLDTENFTCKLNVYNNTKARFESNVLYCLKRRCIIPY